MIRTAIGPGLWKILIMVFVVLATTPRSVNILDLLIYRYFSVSILNASFHQANVIIQEHEHKRTENVRLSKGLVLPHAMK